jgi:hypothetical protein
MPISPEYLPTELHYIIPLAERYGTDAPVASYDPRIGRHVTYGETLSEDDIEPLRHLYCEIRDKGHGPMINEWHEVNSRLGKCPAETTWPIFGILSLFAQLAELGIAPFNDRTVGPRRRNTIETLDWGKLPDSLRYLAGPAEIYGTLQFDDPIYEFLQQRMTPWERTELQALNHRSAQDCDAINRWLDDFPMTEHREAALVYFTFTLLATGVDLGLL